MTRMSGEFVTKVFEGPFKDAPKWCTETQEYAKKHGKEAEDIYFFYTTCPKCAKYYGKNYVVAVAQIRQLPRRDGERCIIMRPRDCRDLPFSPKLPSSNHASRIVFTSGHSSSRIEYHAVSRLRPL